jgi:hypothetical protein
VAARVHERLFLEACDMDGVGGSRGVARASAVTCQAPRHPPPASNPIYVERCPRLERVGRVCLRGGSRVAREGAPSLGLRVRARSLRLAAPPPLVAGGSRSRIVRKVGLSALVASPGDPASRDESCGFRGRIVEPVTEEDSDARRDLFDERLT